MNFVNLPTVYRPYLSSSHRYPKDEGCASVVSGSISWRTFRTISAPSEILSYCRGAIGSLVGRALNAIGEVVLAPVENIVIQRELVQLIRYLDQIQDIGEWSKVETMMNDPNIADRIFEPLRQVESMFLYH
jgi:ABC-type sulfate transport system permease component